MKNNILGISLLSFTFFLFSCGNATQPVSSVVKNDSVKYFDLPLPDTTESVTKEVNGLGAKDNKNYAGKYWMRFYNGIIKSKLLDKHGADYIGTGNGFKLGTVATENLDITDRDLTNVLTPAEFASIITEGVNTQCDYQIGESLNIGALLNADINITSDDALNAQINSSYKNKKNVTFAVKSYQVSDLRVGELDDILIKDTATNVAKKNFYRSLHTKGNVLLSRVVKITGFTADIVLDRDFKAELKAKLAVPVKAKLGDANGSVNVSAIGNKTIHIAAESPFVVFGKFIDRTN